MKFLIIDDEHELYRRMFADLFKATSYHIEEIPRMIIPEALEKIYKFHFSDRVNRHVWIPFKRIWKNCYCLHKYDFDSNEKYIVIFLNGSLRYHFSRNYLREVKRKHPNVELAMILYDSVSNPTAKRSISMTSEFDYILSFDGDDCKKYGFTRIYSTFSKPDFVEKNESMSSTAFFVGYGLGRLEILQKSFSVITSKVDNCRFYIAGVKEENKEKIPGVQYNVTFPYAEELQMAYNTDCIVEIVKEGQTGVSLRTCEAIAFNKKLLTNNQNLQEMPFFDGRFMSVFEDPSEIDIDFIKRKMNVHYTDSNYFSPLKVIEKLQNLHDARMTNK